MKLANYTSGRDNNFNLIRILAAFAVLVSHSRVLATGFISGGFLASLKQQVGMGLGEIAVDVFFITSGFLVTASLLSRKSVFEFLWARLLRIYPALLVLVLFLVFGLGVLFTTMPWAAYFSDAGTWRYLCKNTTMIVGMEHRLPGVFTTNPYPYSVDGSLWSLPYEIWMYLSLTAIWVATGMVRANRTRTFGYALVVLAVAVGAWKLFGFSVDQVSGRTYGRLARLAFAFFSGAAFYALRDRVVISRALFLTLLAALLASAIDKHLFFVVYSTVTPYLLFYCAYVPAGFIRQYNRIGDYSYGVYIYAFPVQQSIAAMIPHIPSSLMCLGSAIATLGLAVLSWHIVERHALKLKDYARRPLIQLP